MPPKSQEDKEGDDGDKTLFAMRDSKTWEAIEQAKTNPQATTEDLPPAPKFGQSENDEKTKDSDD